MHVVSLLRVQIQEFDQAAVQLLNHVIMIS